MHYIKYRIVLVLIAVLTADSSSRTALRKESTLLVIKLVSIQNRMDRNS